MDIFTKAKWAKILITSCVAFVVAASGLGFWLASMSGARATGGQDENVELVFNENRVMVSGAYHTLVIENGRLHAWGSNQYGQVGNNTLINQSLPVQIGGATNWESVAAGGMHSLAINTKGELWAWGQNTYGQLGIDSTEDKSSPTRVGANSNWVMAAAGVSHTLAINEDGELWAWGSNSFGQLGDGTIVDSLEPVQVGIENEWVYVEAGYVHSYAINSDGKLFSWGANGAGQLGVNDTKDVLEPVQVGTDNWTSISAGTLHTLAINENKELFAWGDNTSGQLGDGTYIQRFSPVLISEETNWVTVSAGNNHSLATNHAGQLFSWGANVSGKLGDKSEESRRSPTQITTSSNWVDVAAGYANSYVMNQDRQVSACGDNTYLQLGDGLSVNRNAVARVFPLLNVEKPNNGAGYNTVNLSKSQVSPYGNDSYTFVLNSLAKYDSAEPKVSINLNGIQTILTPIETINNARTYEIVDVVDTIVASDFTVEMPFDVEAPIDGDDYFVYPASADYVYPGETYSFVVERNPEFAEPYVVCSGATVTLVESDVDKFTFVVSNITGPINSADFSVTLSPRYDVEAPTSVADVFTASAPSIDKVVKDQSYTFTITSLTGYTNGVPNVELNSSNGDLTLISTSGNIRTYKVSNVTGEIYATDFKIVMPFNVAAPLGDGVQFTVSASSKNHVFGTEKYTFSITVLDPTYVPAVTLPISKGTLSSPVQVDNVFTYEVSNILSPIRVSDFNIHTELVTYKVAAPEIGTGYSVSDLITDIVVINGSYSFTITSFFGYTNDTPIVQLNSDFADLSEPVVSGVDARTYMVSNVTGQINATDFTVKMPLNVIAPTAGEGYTISGLTTNSVFSGGTFSFKLTLAEGYNAPIIDIVSGATITPGEINGKVYNFTVSSVTAPIISNSYIVNVTPIMYNIATIKDGVGFKVFTQPVSSVMYNTSATFTIISSEGYNNGTPVVTVDPSKGNVALTSKTGNTRLYTISNIMGDLNTGDIVINMPINVTSPEGGTGYATSIPSTTSVQPGGSYTFTITKGLGFTNPIVTLNSGILLPSNVNSNVFTYTVENVRNPISASNFTVSASQILSVAVPQSGVGYTVSAPSTTTVGFGEEYTFTITKNSNYTDPVVTMLTPTALVSCTNSSGNVFTFTVSQVTDSVVASDFTVTLHEIFDVAAPKNGTGFVVTELSKTSVVSGESYTFKITIQEGYNAPVVSLNSNLGNVVCIDVSENEFTYEVFDVKNSITASNFTVKLTLIGSEEDLIVGDPSEMNWFIWLLILVLFAILIAVCAYFSVRAIKKSRSKRAQQLK